MVEREAVERARRGEEVRVAGTEGADQDDGVDDGRQHGDWTSQCCIAARRRTAGIRDRDDERRGGRVVRVVEQPRVGVGHRQTDDENTTDVEEEAWGSAEADERRRAFARRHDGWPWARCAEGWRPHRRPAQRSRCPGICTMSTGRRRKAAYENAALVNDAPASVSTSQTAARRDRMPKNGPQPAASADETCMVCRRTPPMPFSWLKGPCQR